MGWRSSWRGRECAIPKRTTTARMAIPSMREQTYQVHGTQLFNLLPNYISNMTKCPLAPDKYLETIPDEPRMKKLTPGGCDARRPGTEARASNSLPEQTRRAQEGSQMAGLGG